MRASMEHKKCICTAKSKYSKKLLNIGMFMDNLYDLGFIIDSGFYGNVMIYWLDDIDDDDCRFILIDFYFDNLQISNSNHTIDKKLPYNKSSFNEIKKIINS
jgi:hypothetical protein